MPSKLRTLLTRTWTSGGLGALLAGVLGAVLFLFPVGDGWHRLSYDLPFAWRSNIPSDEAVIIYMDELSHQELNQPLRAPWDRALHAQLVEMLITNHARVVVFDILFNGPGPSPAADQRFASAIKAHGRVVLAANYMEATPTEVTAARWLELPHEPLREAAAGWGNVRLLTDPDYGIRRQFPNLEDISGQPHVHTLAWTAAELCGAPATGKARSHDSVRWLNFYGPPGALGSVSYFVNFVPEGIPPGYFSNKVVFIGAKLSADFSGKGKDEFATPYTRWGKGFAPGVEIHATAFLNLLHGDWLTRFPAALELVLILFAGTLAGWGFVRFQPMTATALAVGGGVVMAGAAYWLAWQHQIWFAWMIPVTQLGLALFWAILCTSLKLYVDKRLLEESLAQHLSPACVREILKRPELLRPGAQKQEVSILFSDIANFSKITGRMDAEDLFKLLNKYYDAALAGIHQKDGTTLQLIGDAIFAVWNAPLPQPDHQERVCRAALLLQEQLIQFDIHQLSLPLRTRVGLHTGPACVGNLGSATRFEYSAIGDNINLASRLEGLNKHLGTQILASRDIQRFAEDAMLWRLVGHFKFKGIDRLLEVHELLGGQEQTEATRPWREAFAKGLWHFQRQQFDEAEKQFQLTIRLREEPGQNSTTKNLPVPKDGPSMFYLEKIKELRENPPPAEWSGEIELKEK